MASTKTTAPLAPLFVATTLTALVIACAGCSKGPGVAGAPTDTAKIQQEGARVAAGQAAHAQQMGANQPPPPSGPRGAPVGAPIAPR